MNRLAMAACKSGLGTAIALLLLPACHSKKEDVSTGSNNKKNAVVSVEGYLVRPAGVSEDIDVPGTLLPFEETDLHPEVAGRVTRLNIQEGQFVKQGVLLLKLFDADLQAQLQKLQVQLKIAEKTQQRNQELLNINGISQQDFDLSLLDVNNIKADMAVTQVSIEKTELRAPFDGVIGLRSISMGAYVTSATSVATIRQTNQLKLQFSVPEKYGRDMRPGNTVNFHVDGSKKNYSAHIMAAESGISADTRTLNVRAIVNGKDNALFAGAFAKVNLDLNKSDRALMVPSQAIIPQARFKQMIVYKNGEAEFRQVTTGIRDSARVEILTGINIGDTVITTGLMTVRPKSKLTISKVN